MHLKSILGRARRTAFFLSLLGLGIGSVYLTGCTTGYHKKSADQEVYRIVQQVEAQIFGHTNDFSIDTPYSSRPAAEIHPL